MSKHYRIRVWGKPRRNIDPQMLAQVMLLVARHRARHNQGQAGSAPRDVGEGAVPLPREPELDSGG